MPRGTGIEEENVSAASAAKSMSPTKISDFNSPKSKGRSRSSPTAICKSNNSIEDFATCQMAQFQGNQG